MFLDFKYPSNGLSTSLYPRQERIPKGYYFFRPIKTEQRLQIRNSFQTLADWKDDDMDVSHQIQKQPAKPKIIRILFPDD